jgi:multisubunit Na+/H+ antiporter MnhB subunit
MDPVVPTAGQVSADGQFIWNGSGWLAVGGFRWEPTANTRRMQLLAGAYLLVAGLLTAVLSFFAQASIRQATEKALQQQNRGMTPDQLKAIVDFSVTVGLAVAVFLGLVYIAFGIMTLLRTWTWLFYADLVILGLSGIGVLTNLYGLARGSAGPPALLVPNLVLSAAALALFVWMLMTRLRGGVWASRKILNRQL